MKNPYELVPQIKISLFEYQLECITQIIKRDNTLLLVDAGLGKTIIGLTTAKYYMKKNPNFRILILTKRYLVRCAWLYDNYRILNFGLDVAVPLTLDRAKKLIGPPGITIMNYEKYVSWYPKFLSKIHWDLIICDESKVLGACMSQITQRLTHTDVDKMVLMTAYPAPNNLRQFYPQIVQCGYNKRFTEFMADYFMRPKPTLLPGFWVKTRDTEEKIQKLVENYAVVFTKQHPLVLKSLKFGAKIRIQHRIEFPPALKKIHDVILEEKVYYGDGFTMAATTCGIENIMLRYLSSGAYYIKREEYKVCSSFRVDALMDLIEDIDRPVMVYYCYDFEKDLITAALEKKKYDFRVFSGGLSDSKRLEQVTWLKCARENEVAVCQYQAAKYGDSFNNVKYMIFHSLPYDAEDILQTMERIHRVFQEETVTYYFLVVEESIDEVIYDSFINKENVDSNIKRYLEGRSKK